jgi:glyoxylase-like metal-dependent hydrolase (beta-lactamase superfamily II)
MRLPPFVPGYVRLTEHTGAFLQPDGGFGLSNAGVVAGRDGTTLVDTFFDLPHTRTLLAAVADATKTPVRRVVNTHHNGDHCWGNQLCRDAEIVGHRRCRELMFALPPSLLEHLRTAPPDRPGIALLREGMSRFDFRGIELTPPTVVFDDRLTVYVDGLPLELRYLGPAHTAGDVVAWLPDERVLFTGDLVFRQCAPLGWEGTFARWIEALGWMIGLEPALVVPGHGPIGGVEALVEQRDYLAYVVGEARHGFGRGLSPLETALAIDLGPYGDWAEPERIVFIVARAYRELRGDPEDDPIDFLGLADAMAEYRRRHAA